MSKSRAHSEFGMSTSKRWMSCPASVSLSLKAPPTKEHPSALEGTLTHECLEVMHKHPNGVYAARDLLDKNGHPLERINRAYKAYWDIAEMRQQYKGAHFLAETRVNTSHFTAPGNFGTFDAAILSHFDTLVVIDYKNGVMPVSVEDNTQMIGYALAIARKFFYNFDKVRMSILQPNSRVQKHKKGDTTISMKELKSWEPKFKRAATACLSPNPKVVEGSWCYFCPAKTFNCPAHKDKAHDRALQDFDDV